jgi:DNA helicase IV
VQRLDILEIVPSVEQQAIIHHPDQGTLFVSGPAGSGKTTASRLRLLQVAKGGVDPGSILILVMSKQFNQWISLSAPCLPSSLSEG